MGIKDVAPGDYYYRGSPSDRGQTFQSKLEQGASVINVGLAGDSTGDASVEWFYLTWVLWLPQHPNITCNYYIWDGTSAYVAPVVLQTGTGTVQTLNIYNASMSGSTYAYQQTRLTVMYPATMDMLFMSSGHNYATSTAAAYYAAVDSFIGAYLAVQPNSGIVISSQNPEYTPMSQTWIDGHTARQLGLRAYAERNGYGYLPAAEAFIAGTGPALVSTDGLHPNSAGSTLWAATAAAYLTGLLAPTRVSNIQVFLANGTYTQPLGCTSIRVGAVAGGGSGGAGRQGLAGTVRCGGGAGAGGGKSFAEFRAQDITATVAVVVSAAVNGAAGQTSASTSGANGSTGPSVAFGSYLRATGGGAGVGGTAALGTGGVGGAAGFSGGNGGTASTTGLIGVTASGLGLAAAGGGSGGGITTGDAVSNGGSGGTVYEVSNSGGGTAGVASGGAGGTPANRTANNALAGYGGGGGASSITTAGGAGGNGGSYGGGGGGGGASLDGNTSGAGGNGGPGICVVIST